MKMLLVDDEPGLRMTLAANFELEGFEVVAVPDAESALARARLEPFDVVLSDIRMPGMSGVDLFEQLKPIRPGLPVILMTGFAAEDKVRHAVDHGAYAILDKPFNFPAAARTVMRAASASAVLVIDDNSADAEAMSSMLQAAGVRVNTAHSGEEAVQMVKSGTIDLCIMDLVMPGLSGKELMDQLTQKVPEGVNIIGVSGHTVPALMTELASAGASGFLRKPFAPLDLVRLIAKVRAYGTAGTHKS